MPLHYDIFTDGSSSGNPGPGGWAAILRSAGGTRELSGGFRRTTNNRMELLAAIKALEAVDQTATIDLYSDSRYLVESITKGWVTNWQKKGWVRAQNQKVPNTDLWKRLLLVLQQRTVRFHWVEGHAGHPENERADRLAVAAGARKNLPADEGYEETGGVKPTPDRQPDLFAAPPPAQAASSAEPAEGRPCRKCGARLVKRIPKAKPTPGQKYYYAYYFACPQCGTNYFTNAARREINGNQAA
jgi:ribonuclease HI